MADNKQQDQRPGQQQQKSPRDPNQAQRDPQADKDKNQR